jgi:hypothetical protein
MIEPTNLVKTSKFKLTLKIDHVASQFGNVRYD